MESSNKIEIFVFGSNLAGRHGAGAAKDAIEKYGAIYGVGEGKQGNSYAIPTKDYNLKTLSLDRIKNHVATFHTYAEQNPKYVFRVTRVGCGLAGYKDEDIAPLFKYSSHNVILPEQWVILNETSVD